MKSSGTFIDVVLPAKVAPSEFNRAFKTPFIPSVPDGFRRHAAGWPKSRCIRVRLGPNNLKRPIS